MRDHVVGVVSGGGFQGQVVLESLRLVPNCRVLLLDCFSDNINRHLADGFYQLPPVKSDMFASELIQAVRTAGIQLLFPSTNHELTSLSLLKGDLLREDCHVAVSERESLRLGDKRILYAELRADGLPVLEMLDFDTWVAGGGGPVIGKPRGGAGGKGIRVLEDPDQVGRELRCVGHDVVWQSYLKDVTEYSVDLAVNPSGEIGPMVLRKRVRTSLGFAVVSDSVEDPLLAQLSQCFCEWAASKGCRGLLNVQVLRAATGQMYISDLNMRVGTSAMHGLGEGRNLPRWIASSVLPGVAARGQDAAVRPVRMIRRLTETYIPLRNLGNIRGIVFDLDDTLIDHKSWIESKLRGMWGELSVKLPPIEEVWPEVLSCIEEGPWNRLIDVLLARLSLATSLAPEMIDAYRRFRPGSLRIYPDVEPAVARLRSAGYR